MCPLLGATTAADCCCRPAHLPALSPEHCPAGEALRHFETLRLSKFQSQTPEDSLNLSMIIGDSIVSWALPSGGGIEALSKFQSQTLKDSFRLSEFLSDSDYLRLSKFPSDLQHFFDTFKFLSLPLSPFTSV